MRAAISMTAYLAGVLAAGPALAALSVGAAAVDITPDRLPVVVNGLFTTRTTSLVGSRLFARAIVLDDGTAPVAVVVVDSCMLPRELLDDVKRRAAARTKIPADRMMISATHTHTAPAAGGALGTEADPHYPAFLSTKLVQAIEAAAGRRQPARVGWGVADGTGYLGVRHWVLRSDLVQTDPFGNATVRANMHVAKNPDEAIGPAGPADPALSLVSIQSRDGKPIALLANFGMHYHGVPNVDGQAPLSADYFGLFAERMQTRIGPSLVAMMSQGTSGDVAIRDYFKPPTTEQGDLSLYADRLTDLAYAAYKKIQYRDDATLAMAALELPMRYRTPSAERLATAQAVVRGLGGRPPQSKPEVYAREAVLLHEKKNIRLLLQALRIGEIGITAMPNEVYALSGLKLKLQSPLQPTINITLANGAEGYIPPPELHVLGGYNCWPARSAGLEETAEPKIVEAVLSLLESVAGRPRRALTATQGPAAQAVVRTRPLAYLRLDEMAGSRALDRSGRADGIYEPGVVFGLEGPRADTFTRAGETNRAAHFAGGRLQTRFPKLADRYSVSLWFWNGMPTGVRPVTGVLLGRGHDLGRAGEQVAIGGKGPHEAKIIFSPTGGQPVAAGHTSIQRWTWHNLVLVRAGKNVRVYLDGRLDLEATAPVVTADGETLFIGGGNDGVNGFEGRMDEVAVWNRPLAPAEIARLYAAAGGPAGPKLASASASAH
jgi:hypothetical protein